MRFTQDTERRIVELEGELRAAKSADDFLECHRISTELARLSASLEAARPQKPRDAPGAPRQTSPRGGSAGPPTGEAGAPAKPVAKAPAKPVAEDPFKDFEVGQKVTGTLANKRLNTVWADIGVARHAKISGPRGKFDLLRWGEVLVLVFKSFDRAKGTATVDVPDLEERVAGRGAGQVRLEDVEVGSTVEGRIEGKEFPTVWVDIGAAKPARLYLAGQGKLWRKLALGADIRLKVDRVDVALSEVDAQLAADE